ncbi:DNA-binding SARP family transcriptional activator [Kibdelosporangium banguiense]|uniref:DNA-binding SARP family transcriptional activator n=1 Tax=Kibdelosporangium banguiense TaxID=1365924 RepID=A0ABS4TNE8_9PSEU|nr:DNA-binding SARP family transcriptional activator [Kibdelosporangium banguiense]
MSGVRFEVLGPVRAWLGDAELDIGPPAQASLLSLLLVHAGRPVIMADIVDALWGDDPPRTAVNIVHRAVGALRRLTDPDLPPRATGQLVLPSSGGYRLDVNADMLDLLRSESCGTARGQRRSLLCSSRRSNCGEAQLPLVSRRPYEPTRNSWLSRMNTSSRSGRPSMRVPMSCRCSGKRPPNIRWTRHCRPD